MRKLFIPNDTSAVAMGSSLVANRFKELIKNKSLDIQIIRNGSRGMFWLEPLVEFESDSKRFGFQSVDLSEVESILEFICDDSFDSTLNKHPKFLGETESIEYFKKQQRLSFFRSGIGDPLCIDNYSSLEGFTGLKKALEMQPQQIVDEVKNSGLRGRGGAAFPTGIKWQTVLDTAHSKKYIVCNADEGDSGTFADRLLMESDPYQLIEGMIIAGLAVNANQGYIYLRSEYPFAHATLNTAISRCYAEGILGQNVLGKKICFELEVRLGAGAYICGEETSLLESLEGKRGLVRSKPPLPAIEGLFGCPTVVNNVLTLGAISTILCKGSDYYKNYGTGRSRGTLPVQLSGNIKRGGLIEIPFGISLREIVEDFGGGTFSGNPIKAIQVGGPLGAFVDRDKWDTPMDYEAFSAINSMIGHGGIVVFDDQINMFDQARFAMEFCAIESCGKCTPCRIGSTRGLEVLDKISSKKDVEDNLILLEELCDTMEHSSLCAMGGMTPFPVKSAVELYKEDFT